MELSETPAEQPQQINACTQCGSTPVEEGYPNAFCASCREKFIKFPIPKWVMGTGIAILILVVVGLISFPKQLSTGIHLKRAEKACSGKKYLTAEKELNQVLISSPHLQDAKVLLMIASFYNEHLQTFLETGRDLQGVEFNDNKYLPTLNDLASKFPNYIPSDSLNMFQQRFSSPQEVPQDSFKQYILQHSEEDYAMLMYIQKYYAEEGLAWSDSCVHATLRRDPGYLLGLSSAIYLARMRHRYDSALRYCDKILSFNKESVYAISAKARIYLSEQKIKEGIELAGKACLMDPSDGYSKATLALGYHLNNQSSERDRVVTEMAKDTTMSTYVNYMHDIVSGKEKFN